MVSVGPTAFGTDPLSASYAHEGRAATLPRTNTGIRRLLGGSGSHSTSENRSGHVPNLDVPRRRRSRERTFLIRAENDGEEPVSATAIPRCERMQENFWRARITMCVATQRSEAVLRTRRRETSSGMSDQSSACGKALSARC